MGHEKKKKEKEKEKKREGGRKKKSLRSTGLPTCIKKAAEGSVDHPLRRVVVAIKNIK